jgi:hypothetical protein
LRPSPRLRLAVAAAHGCALALLPMIPWPAPWLLLLGGLLLASAWRGLRPSPWSRVVAQADGAWQLFDRYGGAHRARLCPGGLRHPWLVTLPLRLADGRRCRVSVCADSVAAAEHRALRRWLAGAVSAGGR